MRACFGLNLVCVYEGNQINKLINKGLSPIGVSQNKSSCDVTHMLSAGGAFATLLNIEERGVKSDLYVRIQSVVRKAKHKTLFASNQACSRDNILLI